MTTSPLRVHAVEFDPEAKEIHSECHFEGSLEGWRVRATYRPKGGTVLVTSLTLDSYVAPDFGTGIDSNLLRNVRLTEMYEKVVQHPQLDRELLGWVLDVSDLSDEYSQIRRPGRRGRGRRELAVWAARYVEACQSGITKPNVHLAERHGVSPRTVQDYVLKARKQGLIRGSKQGRAGGELTDEARRLLEEEA